ncbi:MAG: O-antigen ligase family protein [Paucibacter sp.]|nr:O-antigen ligase family protein [Roseateles sp.]
MSYLLIAFYVATPYLVAAAAGLSIAILAVRSYASFRAGMILMVCAFCLDIVALSRPILHIGLTLYTADLPMALLFAIAAARWIVRPDVPRRDPAWLSFALLFLVDFGLGLVIHGTAAGAQARTDFHAIAAGVYALSFPVGRKEIRQTIGALVGAAVVLMLLCVYRWTVYYGNFRDLLPLAGSFNIDGPTRVIGSPGALMIGQLVVVGLFFVSLGRGALWARLLLLPMTASVLVLQHRSVWLALLVGLGASLILVRSHKASRVRQLLMLGALVGAGVIGLAASSALRGQIETSAVRAIQGQDTVSARFSNWKATLTQWREAGPRAIVMGREAGADTTRTVVDSSGRDVRISFGAHNYYIIVLTTMGVVGVALFAWMGAQSLARLYRQSRADDDDAPYASLLLVLLMMQATYYVAYATDLMQFLIFGIASAFAFRRHAEPAEATTAPQARRFQGPVVL